MKLLIVSATEAEISPFAQYLEKTKGNGLVKNYDVDLLITGVGMVATTYALTKRLQTHQYELVVQAGVCGCFENRYSFGEVLFIHTDQYGDLGAQDHEKQLDIFEMGLLEKNDPPYTDGTLVTPMFPIHNKIVMPRVNGVTVNTVSGNKSTIKRLYEKYGCATESMEGAAFHYVCLQERVPFAQVRAISNYVIPRDKSQWKMREAIINLNNWLIGFLEIIE